jgi:hypothetical protein
VINGGTKVFKAEAHKNADATGEVGVFNSNLFQMRHQMSEFQGCDIGGLDGENNSNSDFEGTTEPPKNIYNKRSSLFKNGSKLFYKGFYVTRGKLLGAGDTSYGLYAPTDRSNENPRISHENLNPRGSQTRFNNTTRGDLSPMESPFGKLPHRTSDFNAGKLKTQKSQSHYNDSQHGKSMGNILKGQSQRLPAASEKAPNPHLTINAASSKFSKHPRNVTDLDSPKPSPRQTQPKKTKTVIGSWRKKNTKGTSPEYVNFYPINFPGQQKKFHDDYLNNRKTSFKKNGPGFPWL